MTRTHAMAKGPVDFTPEEEADWDAQEKALPTKSELTNYVEARAVEFVSPMRKPYDQLEQIVVSQAQGRRAKGTAKEKDAAFLTTMEQRAGPTESIYDAAEAIKAEIDAGGITTTQAVDTSAHWPSL